MKKVITMLLIVIYFCQGLLGCFEYSEVQNNNSDRDNQYEEACITPFGKYPETITYTLGKIIGANNSNMPGGDTYENNAYTRYLKEKLMFKIKILLKHRILIIIIWLLWLYQKKIFLISCL